MPAAEVLESPAMTAKPGFHALVGDEFDLHVLAAQERHDEEPRLHHLAVQNIDDGGARTEVDLVGLNRGMVEEQVGRGMRRQSQSVHVEAAVVQFQIPGFIENVTVVLLGREDYDGG